MGDANPDAHANFGYSTVLTAPSPATSGTSLVVQTNAGLLFPAPPFNCTVWPANTQPLSTNAEIIRVTAVASDTLTIVRAQEGTTARSIGVGDQIANTITNKVLTDAETFNIVAVHADQAINTGVLNLLTDITGLSFPVTAGNTYFFRAFILYTADASTTGSRWTINGPAMTFLAYRSEYTLTATTTTPNTMLSAIQLPAASNATSNVSNGGGNFATVEGIVRPSANGTIQIQGAREVTLGTITVKAGSYLQYRQMDP